MQTVEQDFAEIGGEEEEADEVRPNVDRLVVHPEPAVMWNGACEHGF